MSLCFSEHGRDILRGSLTIIIIGFGLKSSLYYIKYTDTKKLATRDASPPCTFAAAPVFAGEFDGLDEDGVNGGAGGAEGAEGVAAATEGVVEAVPGATLVGSGCGATVVVVTGPGIRPPVSGGTAYGGSNRPNPPHAPHGEAHSLTGLGAARIGSQRLLGPSVSIAVAGLD